MRMRFIWAATICCLLLCVSACDVTPQRYQTEFSDYLGVMTQVTVTLEGTEDFAPIEHMIDEELAAIDRVIQGPEGDLPADTVNAINASAGEGAVAVSERLQSMLEAAEAMRLETADGISVAQGTLNQMWHDAWRLAQDAPAQVLMPNDTILEAIASNTLGATIQLDAAAHTVQFVHPDVRLDLSPILRGYATDRVMTILMDQGIQSAMVNVGGVIRTLGYRADEDLWRLAIQNPAPMLYSAFASILSVAPDQLIGRPIDGAHLALMTAERTSRDTTTTTSLASGETTTTVPTAPMPYMGDGQNVEGLTAVPAGQQQFLTILEEENRGLATISVRDGMFIVNGRVYHENIDPATGRPTTGYQSVTVTAPTALDAEAIARALHTLKLEDGWNWVQSLDGVEALWVDPLGAVIHTDGFILTE